MSRWAKGSVRKEKVGEGEERRGERGGQMRMVVWTRGKNDWEVTAERNRFTRLARSKSGSLDEHVWMTVPQ